MHTTLVTVLTILFSVGGTAAVTTYGKAIRSFFTGRAADERDRIQRLTRERDDADAWRRIIQEHASELRGILNEHGLKDLVPPWPERPTSNETPTRRSRRS